MSAKTLNTVEDLAKLNAAKEAARQCSLAADKFLKTSHIQLARQQLEKARELDPSNAYIYAFQDRIAYFEEKKKKDVASGVAPAPTTPTQYTIPKPVVKAVPTTPTHPPEHKAKEVTAILAPASAPAPEGHTKEERASAPLPQVDSPLTEERKEPPSVHNPVEESKPIMVAEALRGKGIKARSAEEQRKLDELRRQEEVRAVDELRRKELEARAAKEQRKLEEMRRQIEELTQALKVEKEAREEITRLNLQNSVKQLRSALEAAWVNGAPVDAAANALHGLAISLEIPPDVELSIIREVKLDMYRRRSKRSSPSESSSGARRRLSNGCKKSIRLVLPSTW